MNPRAQSSFPKFFTDLGKISNHYLGMPRSTPHDTPLYQQVGIPNPDPLQPCFLRNLLTPQGMGSSGGWQVAEIELRVKGQEGVGDLGAHGGNQPGNGPYFIVIDISRNQQRACDQKWRIRPPAHPSAQIPEVLYRPLIAHSA